MTGHLSPDRIADYLGGLAPDPRDEELEAHLFSCSDCALEAAKLSGLMAAVHRAVPPALSHARFEELEREGRIAAVNPMTPGQVAEVRFPPEDKLLIHRLGGADLRRARRVDVDLLDLEGRSVRRLEDVPFDAARGEVLIACQRHFARLTPADIVFRLEVLPGDREGDHRYTVLHRL